MTESTPDNPEAASPAAPSTAAKEADIARSNRAILATIFGIGSLAGCLLLSLLLVITIVAVAVLGFLLYAVGLFLTNPYGATF